MSLKSLTTAKMLSVLDPRVDPRLLRPKIELLARSATLLPDLESARTGLQESHAVSTKASPELIALQGVAGGLGDRRLAHHA